MTTEPALIECAITAMGISAPGVEGLDAFDRAIFDGRLARDAAASHWSLIDACKCVLHDVLAACNPITPLTLLVGQADAVRVIRPYFTDAFACIECANMQQAMSTVELLTTPTSVLLIGVHGRNSDCKQQASFDWDGDFKGYRETSGVAWCLLHSSADKLVTAKPFADVTFMSLQHTPPLPDYLELSITPAPSKKSLASSVRWALGDNKPLQTALGCVGSLLGNSGGFTEVAGMVKTALVVNQRYLPGMADWQAPKDTSLDHGPFYVPSYSQPWLGEGDYIGYLQHGMAEHTRLWCMSAKATQSINNGYLATSPWQLIPVTFFDHSQAEHALHTLVEHSQTLSLTELAQWYSRQWQAHEPSTYTLCLLASSIPELRQEITLAKTGIAQALVTHTPWRTPRGSYFSGQAFSKHDNAPPVAFMYPGIGASYLDFGHALFHLFPRIEAPLRQQGQGQLQAYLRATQIYPRTWYRLTYAQKKQQEYALRSSLAAMAECGVSFAMVLTAIMQTIFKVKPCFAAGYSMGEASMFAALGGWQNPAILSKRLQQTAVFNGDLTDAMTCVKHDWDQAGNDDSPIEWETFTVRASAAVIQHAIVHEPRVYMTIINASDSVVIAGQRHDCERVIKTLGVKALPLGIANAIHCKPAQQCYEAMVDLYTLPMDKRSRPQTVGLFSSSCYLPIPLRSQAVAHALATCLCEPVDFPRLMTSLYQQGARVFIEMGPGRSLFSLMQKNLTDITDKPNDVTCCAMDTKGMPADKSIRAVLAQLISHGVRPCLDALCTGSVSQPTPNRVVQ